MSSADPHTSTFLSGVDRGVSLAVGIVILGKSVVFSSNLYSTFPDISVYDKMISATILTLVGISAVRLIMGRASGWDVASCSTALALAFCLGQTWAGPTPAAGAMSSPIVNLSEPLLAGVALLSARACLANLIGHFAVFTIARGITGGSEGLIYGLEEATWMTGVVLGAFVLIHALRGAAKKADQSRSEFHAALLNSTTDKIEQDADQQASRLIHDTVLTALVAAEADPTSTTAQQSATAALESLGDSAQGDDSPYELLNVVQTVVRASAVNVTVFVEPRLRASTVPSAVSATLGECLAELLRNVERHSGTMTAVLDIERFGRSGLQITLIDRGTGFDPMVPPGVGLGSSVLGRMAGISGSVDIESEPGRGSRVSLIWPNESWNVSYVDAFDEISSALESPSSVLLRAMAPLLCISGGAAVLFVWAGGQSPKGLLAAAVLGILTVVLARRASHSPLSPTLVVLITAVMLPCTALGLSVTETEQLGQFGSWAVELASIPIIIVAFIAPVRAILLPLGSQGVVICWFAFDAGLTVAELPHLLVIQPMNVLFVAAVASMTRRNGRIIRDFHQQEVNLKVEGIQKHARAAAVDEALCGRRTEVTAMLTHIASQHRRRDLSADAGLMCLLIRDGLYFPGARHKDFRNALQRLRASGCRISVHTGLHPPPTQHAAQLVNEIGTINLGARRLTLTFPDDQSRQRYARLVIVPAIDPSDVASLDATDREFGIAIESDDDATIVTVLAPARDGATVASLNMHD